MLALQSNIQQQAEITSLSITSQSNTNSKNQNPSTNQASIFDKGEDSSPCLKLESKNKQAQLKSPRTKDLMIRLNYLKKMQENLNNKMNGYVDVLEREIKKKQQDNNRIQKVIKELHQEVQQSKTDIMTLSQIFNKRKKIVTNTSNRQINGEYELNSKNGVQVSKNGRSTKKIFTSPITSGRMLISKPGSPNNKESNFIGQTTQHGSPKGRDSQKAQNTIKPRLNLGSNHKLKNDKKSTKLISCSPIRHKILMKSP